MPGWRLHAAVEFTDFSRIGSPNIVDRSNGAPVAPLVLNYRNGWKFALGTEYDLTSSFVLRSGLAYELSPITVHNRSTRLPDINRVWASIGASYRYSDSISLDLGFTHYFNADPQINIVQGNPNYISPLALVAVSRPNISVLALGLTYRY